MEFFISAGLVAQAQPQAPLTNEGISLKLLFFVIIVGMVFFSGVIELVRRRKLNEEFSVIWLLVVLSFVSLAFFPKLFIRLASYLGVESPINIVFFLSILGILLLLVYFSFRVSVLNNRIRKLSQKIALMDAEITSIGNESGRNKNEQPEHVNLPEKDEKTY